MERSPGAGVTLLGRLVLVAAAYFVCARLGLLLAIPPGYATAVWPASGIALAAILLWGRGMAAGIFFGSLLANIASAGLDLSHPLDSSLLPVLIAAGAAAQASVGAMLVHRFGGYTNLLTQESGVARMLLLGGPLACLLNASVGVGSLWLAGRVPSDVVWINWFTWWVGDCIGVLIFTPLALIWALRPYRQWLRRQLLVTVPMAVLFVTVVALFIFVSQREQQRIATEFDAAGADIAGELERDLNSTLSALGALEGIFAASQKVEDYEFQIFAARLRKVMPGADALSWDAVDGDGKRVAVSYISPMAGNEPVLGFDPSSEPVRRAALELARDTGRAAVTGEVDLVQAPGERGVVVFLPVYRHGVQPASLDARRRYIEGYAAAIFRIDRLMAASASRARAAGFTLNLFDDTVPGSSHRLYGEPQDGVAPGGLAREYRFSFSGRSWRLSLQMPAAVLLAHRSWATWLVLAGGLFLASLVGLLLLLGIGREARIEALVAGRTAELSQLNAVLTAEAYRREQTERESERRATALAESNAELQRRAEINRQLLGSLRHSEAELRRTATQLAASNRELEQFAYVASHDLKAPLRSIGSFAQLLERRLTNLSPESLEFLKFIQDGIRQMQALIDDLLQLSRVDARRLEPHRVEMAAVVDKACRALTADLNASKAKVHIGSMPELTADANMLTQLLQNLVGNALKFQKPGNTPEIWIDSVAEGDDWHFTVRDNGIGIDPSHLTHIFLVFKRLHTPDQYPGNGIGLAICKKVVTLHGGEIWAESNGQGATFHFTLPRRMAERAAA